MGSTGSGSFSDYSRRKPASAEEKNGGTSGVDQCSLAFQTSLEEVSRCFYYINYSKVPDVDTEITVVFNGIRMAIENLLGEELGYLPTKFNYLRLCLSDNFKYSGIITFSTSLPTPTIRVDITPL